MSVLQSLWSPRNRWKVLLSGWVFVSALYCWGIAGKQPDGEDWSWWDRLYVIPDVFSFGVVNEVAALDARIQAARFLGPAVAAASFFQASAVLFKEQIDDWRLSRLKGHVIVCGAGEKGGRIARDFARQGRGTVVIERDPASQGAAAAKAAGAFVVGGDAADPETLRRAGVRRAADLVALAGADGRNVEITTVARDLHQPTDPTLTCSVHLLDGELCHLLRLEELRGQQRGVRTDFMNVFQRGARFWLHDADPLATASGTPHVVIVGADELCTELVVVVLQSAADRTAEPDIRLTWIAADVSDRLEVLRLHHPRLVEAARVTTIALDAARPGAGGAATLSDLYRDGDVTSVFVGLADETAALTVALTAQRLLTPRPVPVHVRTQDEGGLALLFGRIESGGPELRGFGFYDRTCTAAAIDGGTAEALAQSLHADYQVAARRDGVTGPLTVDWDELPDAGRESNRAAAAHIVDRLDAIGCSLVPMFRWDDTSFELTDDQVETLARLEHERWMAERAAAGWRYGEVRDNDRKLNPLLRPWADLDDAGRAANRATARALPGQLARAGFEIVAASAGSARRV